GEADFRLSGFEWSLRLSSVMPRTRNRGRATDRVRAPELERANAQFSFATDWFDFGLLAAETLAAIDVRARGTKSLERVREDIVLNSNLSIREKDLLQNLLAIEADDRLREGTSVI